MFLESLYVHFIEGLVTKSLPLISLTLPLVSLGFSPFTIKLPSYSRGLSLEHA